MRQDQNNIKQQPLCNEERTYYLWKHAANLDFYGVRSSV